MNFMKLHIDYQKVLDRANVILKDNVEKAYRDKFPSLDINLVTIYLDESAECMFKALIEAINQEK